MSKCGVFSEYFPAFGLNTEGYSVSLRIQSECGKIWTRKNSVSGNFSCSDLIFKILQIDINYLLKRIGATRASTCTIRNKRKCSQASYMYTAGLQGVKQVEGKKYKLSSEVEFPRMTKKK